MSHLTSLPGIRYTTCVTADRKTFTHMCFFQDEAAQPGLFGLQQFKDFQVSRAGCGARSGVTDRPAVLF